MPDIPNIECTESSCIQHTSSHHHGLMSSRHSIQHAVHVKFSSLSGERGKTGLKDEGGDWLLDKLLLLMILFCSEDVNYARAVQTMDEMYLN